MKDQLIAINARLMDFRAPIKEYRTKRGCPSRSRCPHVPPAYFGAFPPGAEGTFLRDLGEFLRIAMNHLDLNEHVSLQIAMSEDVDSLVVALAKSVVFDQCPTCMKGTCAVLDVLGR